jgi:hypothetical protein
MEMIDGAARRVAALSEPPEMQHKGSDIFHFHSGMIV